MAPFSFELEERQPNRSWCKISKIKKLSQPVGYQAKFIWNLLECTIQGLFNIFNLFRCQRSNREGRRVLETIWSTYYILKAWRINYPHRTSKRNRGLNETEISREGKMQQGNFQMCLAVRKLAKKQQKKNVKNPRGSFYLSPSPRIWIFTCLFPLRKILSSHHRFQYPYSKQELVFPRFSLIQRVL